ncbi:hypothetical protein [Bdellovibrio sp. HCB2-146]|uniref:hypothetical protein n=1 Tax=Bdellovibrio sp. HCB2-146 TaxID=3394362 RepID=UPI0039BC80B0
MPLRVKNSQKLTGLNNNSGQALIEYVLILVITVSLVLALIYQVFKPFQNFIQSYMGSYVQCLLETGELPSFGYGEAAINEEGCDAKFAAASWNKGRPPIGTGGNTGNNQSSSSQNSGSSGSDSSSGSGGGSYAGSNSRNGRSMFRAPRSAPRGVGEATTGGKVVEIALDGNGAGGFFKGSTGGGYVRPARKITAVGITGLTEEEKKKLAKKAENGGKQMVVQGGLTPPVKKIAVKKPEPKPQVEAEESGFTIGNFIRILFIAALIIALVIFIGGQALQMSKSFEK